jgi:hypothetical protein
MLKNIFDPVEENSVWRIRTDQELINLYRETDINLELGLLKRMPEEITVRKVSENTTERKTSVRKPRNR